MFKPLNNRPNGDVHRAETVVLQPLPGIGDMVWHLPVLQAIAATDPSGTIDLVTHERLPVAPLMKGEFYIGRTLSIPVGRKMGQRIKNLRFLVRALKGQGYRRAIVLHHSWRYTLAMWLAGIPVRHAYGLGHQRLFITQTSYLAQSERKLFPLQRANKLLDMLGIAVNADLPKLNPPPDAVQAMEAAYADQPKPWVCFAIGATQPGKIWPPDRFAAVADALHAGGYRTIFLLGAPHEGEQARAIISHCKVAQPVSVTDRPLDQTIALIACCDFGFCNDSGLMNVCGAVGVPAYGLYLATPPLDYSPLLHAILPDDGVIRSSEINAAECRSISVENALNVLRQNGIPAS